MQTFAENLKRLRKEAQLTQNALAAVSGVTQANISKYETGEAIPELSSLLKLAAGLEIPLEPLVEGLDVRFDAVYKGLHISISTDDTEGEPGAAEPVSVPPTNPPLEQIVPGYDGTRSVIHNDPPENVAPAATVLDRIMADLLTLRGRIVSGSDSVDDRRRPGSSEGPVRRRVGSRGKTRPKKTPKRPSNRKAR
jgi:transcriptional regulator with XRE-family HTH domain